jgi:hypothetical protein
MAKEEKKEEKKIIIDEDWKQEAQKEKEVLAAQEDLEKEKGEGERERGPLPPGNFAALVSMLVTQAMFALGVIKVEGQEDRGPDLEMAKYNIDMLGTLEEKTKGNLTKSEEKVLKDTLNQARMAFVQVSEKKQ